MLQVLFGLNNILTDFLLQFSIEFLHGYDSGLLIILLDTGRIFNYSIPIRNIINILICDAFPIIYNHHLPLHMLAPSESVMNSRQSFPGLPKSLHPFGTYARIFLG